MLVRGKEYAVRDLPLMTQFSLAAKLSPVISMMALQKDKTELKRVFPKSFTAMCENMPVEEHQWVLNTCLGTVLRCGDGAPPVPVWIGGMPAFQDVNLDTMLELLWEVLIHHRLIDFFSVAPSDLIARPGGQEGSSGSDDQTDKIG